MLRTRLALAAGAAALIAGAALAQTPAPQDPPLPEPAPEVPLTPESPAAPQPEPDVRDVEPATAAGTPAGQAQTEVQAEGDVLVVLRREGEFSTLISALEASGLVPVIQNNPDITIFAPTDAAFAALPAGELERLMQPANVAELRALLLYHLINADVRPDDILNRRGAVMTGGGAQIMLDGAGGQIRADAATVTRSDLRGSNGAVFVIDQVLDPERSLAEDAPDEADPQPPAATPADGVPPPTENPAASPPPSESPAAQELERPPGAHPPVDDAPDEDDLDEPDAA